MQKFRINKLAGPDHAKHALKRATTWYAQEKDKPSGLLSYQIEKKVKKEYDGVGLHAATIWRYINANIAGMSPLKIGVKGNVPTFVFKSFCIAFKSFICIQQTNSHQGKITYKKLAARINALLRPIQKRTAVAAVLDFTNKEWESLKRLRDADATERKQGATADDNYNNTGVLGMENWTIVGKHDEGAV